MNVENNHTAEAGGEQTKDGSHTITIQTTLGDEGEPVGSSTHSETHAAYVVLGPSFTSHHNKSLAAVSASSYVSSVAPAEPHRGLSGLLAPFAKTLTRPNSLGISSAT